MRKSENRNCAPGNNMKGTAATLTANLMEPTSEKATVFSRAARLVFRLLRRQQVRSCEFEQ